MIRLLTCFLGNNAKQVVCPGDQRGLGTRGHWPPTLFPALESGGGCGGGWQGAASGRLLATPKNVNEGGSGKLTNA